MHNPRTALTIAGFDGSGGAGIQADLKTFSAWGCYGMTILTALPVQNTCGVRNCYPLPLQAIKDQLQAIFDDITPDCIKIGMLYSADIIETVAEFLKTRAVGIPVVLDPVTVAKSGDPLLLPEAMDNLKSLLIPLCTLVTPNLPEASALTGIQANTPENMPALAKAVLTLGSRAVLLKGGHLESAVSHDLLLNQQGELHWLEGNRIASKNTHGTGCTLSAAIAAGLAQGMALPQACLAAKKYVFQAIFAAKDQSLGQGHGPVHHFYHLWPEKGFPSMDKPPGCPYT